MKCITNNIEVRRVSDKIAEHYISREGWSYCQKKERKEGYTCPECGKHYLSKPEKCSGFAVVHRDKKRGVAKRIPCGSKVFNKEFIYAPVWK